MREAGNNNIGGGGEAVKGAGVRAWGKSRCAKEGEEVGVGGQDAEERERGSARAAKAEAGYSARHVIGAYRRYGGARMREMLHGHHYYHIRLPCH